jgi:hypothetical protein
MTIHLSQEGQAPSTTPAPQRSKWIKRIVWGSLATLAVIGVFTLLMTLLFVHGVSKSITPLSPQSQPTAQQPSASSPPSAESLPVLPPSGPTASTPMKQMAVQLANLRQEAFCTGGAKGQAMLDQVWAYHGQPRPLQFSLQNAYNAFELAPKRPHSTYSRDLQQLKSGVGCNGVVAASLMKVTESYDASGPSRVVVSQFVDGHPSRVIDAYTAVYIQINGRWHIDQMH